MFYSQEYKEKLGNKKELEKENSSKIQVRCKDIYGLQNKKEQYLNKVLL